MRIRRLFPSGFITVCALLAGLALAGLASVQAAAGDAPTSLGLTVSGNQLKLSFQQAEGNDRAEIEWRVGDGDPANFTREVSHGSYSEVLTTAYDAALTYHARVRSYASADAENRSAWAEITIKGANQIQEEGAARAAASVEPQQSGVNPPYDLSLQVVHDDYDYYLVLYGWVDNSVNSIEYQVIGDGESWQDAATNSGGNWQYYANEAQFEIYLYNSNDFDSNAIYHARVRSYRNGANGPSEWAYTSLNVVDMPHIFDGRIFSHISFPLGVYEEGDQYVVYALNGAEGAVLIGSVPTIAALQDGATAAGALANWQNPVSGQPVLVSYDGNGTVTFDTYYADTENSAGKRASCSYTEDGHVIVNSW